MMKKYRMIVILLIATLLLCSCKKNEKVMEVAEIPSHVTRELEDNLSIDAAIILPEQAQFEIPILKLEAFNFDTQNIISTFYPNAGVLNQEDGIYEDGEDFIKISDGYYSYDDYSERIYTRFFTQNSELLYPKVPNLEGLDAEIALAEAKKYLSELGIENIELNEYYVLNKVFLEENYNEIKQGADWKGDVEAGREVVRENWEDEKGAYIFNFNVLEGEVPISQVAYLTRDREVVQGSSIYVGCNENGIVMAEVANYCTVKDIEGYKKLVGIEPLVAALEHKFSNLIIQEPIVINTIKLVYQVQKIRGKLYLMPIWEVEYLQHIQGIGEKGISYFDIETGKEIVLY